MLHLTARHKQGATNKTQHTLHATRTGCVDRISTAQQLNSSTTHQQTDSYAYAHNLPSTAQDMVVLTRPSHTQVWYVCSHVGAVHVCDVTEVRGVLGCSQNPHGAIGLSRPASVLTLYRSITSQRESRTDGCWRRLGMNPTRCCCEYVRLRGCAVRLVLFLCFDASVLLRSVWLLCVCMLRVCCMLCFVCCVCVCDLCGCVLVVVWLLCWCV